MDAIFPTSDPALQLAALGIAFCSGFVKGVVGFAMPLVFVSGLTLFLSPEWAVAGLVLPTLVSNLAQATRQGVTAALATVRDLRVFLIAGGCMLVATAQLFRVLDEAMLLFAIGVPTLIYSVLQLAGVRFRLQRRTARTDLGVGTVAGALGGLAGVWGPPTVMYLTALETAKKDQMRIQGVIYGLGAVALLGAHFGSGVVRAETLPFSALLIVPAVLGMLVGGKAADRIDQQMFRRATLIVLLIAGANLIRRAIF